MSHPKTRKWCVVPKCGNTTTKTPEKLFFLVPIDKKLRRTWIKLIKRADYSFGDKSKVYCCEDHFDVENDMANYMKHKLMGGCVRLKRGVLPHKFPWTKPNTNRAVIEKRERAQRSELVNKLLSGEIPAAEGTIEEIFIVEPVQEQEKEEKDPDPLNNGKSDEEVQIEEKDSKKHNRKIQVCIKPTVHNKSTMTEVKYLAAPPRKRKLKRKPKK